MSYFTEAEAYKLAGDKQAWLKRVLVVGGSYGIIIPKALLDRFNLGLGTQLAIDTQGDTIRIRRVQFAQPQANDKDA